MAFVEHKECPICEKVTRHVNRKCVDCEDRRYRQEVAAWNALSVEERLQDLRRRMEALEAGPPRY